METNINQLMLALKGKVDFIKKTNPWGSEEKEEEKQDVSGGTNPQQAAMSLIAWAQRMSTPVGKGKP